MKYRIQSPGGEALEIEIRDRPDGRLELLRGGEALPVEVSGPEPSGALHLLAGDRSLEAWVEEGPGGKQVRVHLAGRSFTFEVLDERELLALEVESHRPARPETVQARMPGVVVDVRVAPGQAVAAGDAVLVLEAMKMQNEVTCEQGGVVAEVLVERGAAVEAGQDLIRLQPAPED